MQLAFDNPHFVAADKPAGWLSVPARTGAADPRTCLGLALEAALGLRLWPVHRLDAEVSGLILFAKNADAHRAANGWFERREVEKRYEALTDGDPGAAAKVAGVWRSRILRGKKRAYESPHGKDAETVARLLGRRGDLLAWDLEPRTGRPHQLRYELAKHGFPIAGDSLYGSTRPHAGGGIALRCVGLGFAGCGQAAELGLPEALAVPSLPPGAAT